MVLPVQGGHKAGGDFNEIDTVLAHPSPLPRMGEGQEAVPYISLVIYEGGTRGNTAV